MPGNAISVGGIAFDLTLNTSTLNNAVNAAAQQVNSQLTAAFRSAMTSCEGSISQLGSAVGSISGDINSSLATAANGIQASMNEMARDIANAVTASSQVITRQMGSNTRSLTDSMRDAMSGIAGIRDQSRDAAGTIGGSLTSAVKKLGAAILSAFAIKQIVRFTKSCVEAAAQVKALNAQVQQTFKTLESDALSAIRAVADESGVLETRLQSTGAQIYAFAKTTGMDSTQALVMMQEALKVTADSAAYYDRSIEDTAESLRSFLKGNYANDAALGISCTETTRNAEANKLYGKSFMELSEAQKQLTLLQMVKDANELSGAMGQAAREADGWENVTGNLKEAWKQFKAAIGKPLLEALIPVIKNITSAIQSLTQTAREAAAALGDLFGWDLSSAQSTGDAMTDIADSAAKAQDSAQDEIEETEKKAKKTQKSLASFDDLNVLKQPDEDSGDGDKKAEANNAIAISAQLAKKEIDDLQKSIGGISFDGLRESISNIIGFFTPVTNAVKHNASASVETAQKTISKFITKYGDDIKKYGTRIKTNLEETAVNTRDGITTILDEAANSQERCSEDLSNGYSELLGGASIFALSFADTISSALSISSGNFATWATDNRTTIGEFFDGVNGNIANFSTTFGGILGDIGTKLSEWWENSGSEAFNNLSEAFASVKTTLLEFWNTYISPFIDFLIDSVRELWDEHLSGLWSSILEFISSVMNAVSVLWTNVILPIYEKFGKTIVSGFVRTLKHLWRIATDLFGWVADVFKSIITIAGGLLDFFTGVFTGDFKKCLNGIKKIVKGVCDYIWAVIKGVVNVIIDALNLLWSGVYTALKTIVDGLGGIAEAAGDLFGQDWGFSLPDEPPEIPRLATGGLVKAPTLAIVGDNPNASRDPEVVAPLSKLGEMMNNRGDRTLAEILSYMKMIYDVCVSVRDIEASADRRNDADYIFRSVVNSSNAYKRMHGGRSAL